MPTELSKLVTALTEQVQLLREDLDTKVPTEAFEKLDATVKRVKVISRRSALLSIIMAFMLVFGTWGYLVTRNNDVARARQIEEKSRENCEAGNERSRLAMQSLTEQRQRTEAFDFKSLAIDPSQADDLKRQSLESTDHQMASLPFLDCPTGKRVPAPIP